MEVQQELEKQRDMEMQQEMERQEREWQMSQELEYFSGMYVHIWFQHLDCI